MLVLNRRPKEVIYLPELGIKIYVVSIQPGQVKIGFEAPEDVLILRSELMEESDAEELSAISAAL